MQKFIKTSFEAVSGRNGGLSQAHRRATWGLLGIIAVVAACWIIWHPFRAQNELLVMAYDSSREFLEAINTEWVNPVTLASGQVKSVHEGSVHLAGREAETMVADVLLLASHADMSVVQQKTRCLPVDWNRQYPNGASPFFSTVVILVRSGNPHEITDWDDLYKESVKMGMPDPRWSGAGRYAYLALVLDALTTQTGDRQNANLQVRELLMSTDLIPHGAHRAFEVFSRNDRLDAFLTWESEALRIVRTRPMEFEIIYPEVSLLAEPVVALMECHVEKRGCKKAALAYLNFLYSRSAQEIAAKAGLRPRMDGIRQAMVFNPIELQTVEAVFGTWEAANTEHFGPDGTLEYTLQLREAQAGGFE